MTDRVDATGAARAGSQLQTQLYVNERRDEVNYELLAEFPELTGARIEWRSPLADDGYREYWDAGFLDRVRLAEHAAGLKSFWPTGGPHWDALATVHEPGGLRPGVLLVEGKSYPAELRGGGCKAEPGSVSRELIEQSLAWTQERLGVTNQTAENWCGPLYQTANRLAHLCWLRSLGIRAWLAHLLFVDDPLRPTTADEWMQALEAANRDLGLTRPVDGAAHVLLPAVGR